MAYVPVSLLATQYDEQDGYFLKFYMAGLTEPFAMSIDASGITTLDKAQLDSDGFITTDGTEIFIPFVDQSYDAFLFATAALADANDTNGAIRIANNANPFGDLAVGTIVADEFIATAGQSVFSIGVAVTAVSVYIDGRYQKPSNYLLVTSTGTVTLSESLSIGQSVTIIHNDIIGTSIAFDKSFEVVSLRDYVTDVNDANSALIAACADGRIVDFAGLNLSFPTDFNMPLSSVCSEWRLNGSTVNFLTGVCNLGTNSMTIDLQDGRIKGGIKKAQVTINSTANGNQFTVANASDFSVGDQVSCSFDNQFLPNSTSQLGTLGEFNTITDITSNVITMKFNVPAVVPANAWLLNGRFDKNGINYSGTGYLRIKNGSVSDFRTGYFVSLLDTTQQSKFFTENVIYDNAALDQFLLRCHSAFFKGCHIGRSYDIAKQSIVSSHNVEGVIVMEGVTVKRFNGDGLFFIDDTFNKVGGYTLRDCHIDGFNDMSFSGSAQDFQDRNTLHLWGFSNGAGGLNPEIGHVIFEGGEVKNVLRSVFGTSFNTRNTFTFKSFTMSNVNCLTDPIVMRITDYENSKPGSTTINNCDVVTGTNDLGSGYSIGDSLRYIFNGGTLKLDSTLQAQTVCNISRNQLNTVKILQGDLGESFRVSGHGSVLNQIKLDKKVLPSSGQLAFLSPNPQMEKTKLLLSGKDFTDLGYIDPSEWFDAFSSRAPNLAFNFPQVGVSFDYGDPLGGVIVNYVSRLHAETWDGLPYSSLGHYTIWVPNGSTVEGAGGQRGLVDTIFSTTINATTLAGNNTITVTSVPAGMVEGSIIGLADIQGTVDGLSSFWYKIDSIAGLVITLTTNLDIDVAATNPLQGFNVVPESSYKNNVVNNIAPPGSLAPEFIGQQYIDTSVPNTYTGTALTAGAWTQTN